jgi:enamine deaminase RidA (YjgF/YER057c/UK114 family)
MSADPVEVVGWPRPRGYSNGMLGTGRALHVAGQIGWLPDASFPSEVLLDQFGLALQNVVAVVRAAGGGPGDIASMTVFVTDISEYRAQSPGLGPVWRAHMGKHFPAMALVAVSALVEPKAKVEICAVAYVAAAEDHR